MKRTLLAFLFILSISYTSFAQCSGERYRNYVFNSFDITTDVVYGSNLSNTGAAVELKMDIYEPSGDNETNRPLIVVCHGGYFLAGDKAEVDVVPMCQNFAKMGYVVASINYRVGIAIANPLQVPYGQAVVRSVQDLRAAVRWFRKNVAEEGNTYDINTDMIFVGGDSAGGFMALHHAYFDESEIPDWLDMTASGMEGGMEGNSGNPGYSSEAKAIFSVSGALGDVNWIDAEDTTPACLFHGDDDQTVTIDSDMFVLFNILNVTEIDGSNPINARMDELGIEHCYKINEGSGHVPYLGNAAILDSTMSIISGFLSHFVCDVPLDCNYHELTSSVENLGNDVISIFPNPCAAGQSIRFGKNLNNALVSLLDLNGKILLEKKINGQALLLPTEIPSGIYFVKVVEGKEVKVARLVVE